jgi:cytochrome c-type biogenesis protein CcmH/NrfG
MAINGLITKVIFDKNPENEFFVEESYPLDWMYPYLTPFGVIMKINRQPLPSLSEEVLAKDHEFWKQYSKRMTGDILDYDTKVEDVAKWIEKTYLRHNMDGFTGDRKFLRDKDAPKAFSKLRSSIGGIYAWRLNPQTPSEYRPKTEAETIRLYKEANFTFLQAFAICPYSPEAVFRYVNFLLQPPAPMQPRFDDALIVAKICEKLDPNNGGVSGLVNNLESWKKQQAEMEKNQAALLPSMEAKHAQTPDDLQLSFNLAEAYRQSQNYSKSCQTIDSIVTNPTADISAFELASSMYTRIQGGVEHIEEQARKNPSNAVFSAVLAETFRQLSQADRANQALDAAIANPNTSALAMALAGSVAVKLGAIAKVEAILERGVKLSPSQPEPWFDLAVMKTSLNKLPEALIALSNCVDSNAKRLQANPKANNVVTNIPSESRLAPLRSLPEYQQIMSRVKTSAEKP